MKKSLKIYLNYQKCLNFLFLMNKNSFKKKVLVLWRKRPDSTQLIIYYTRLYQLKTSAKKSVCAFCCVWHLNIGGNNIRQLE